MKMIQEFRAFAIRGDVVEAVGARTGRRAHAAGSVEG